MSGYGGYLGDGTGYLPPDYRSMDQRVQNYSPNVPPMPPTNHHSHPIPIEVIRKLMQTNAPIRVRLYLCEHLRRHAPQIFTQGPLTQQQKSTTSAKYTTKSNKQLESQPSNQVVWKGYISRNGTKVVPVIATSHTNDALQYIKVGAVPPTVLCLPNRYILIISNQQIWYHKV